MSGVAPLDQGPTPAEPAVGTALADTRPFDMSGPRFWATGDYLLTWYTPMRTVPLIQSVPSAQVGNATLTGVTTIFPDANNHINFGAFSGVRAGVGANWETFGLDVGGFVLERQTQRASVFNDGTPFVIARGYTSAGSGNPAALFVSLPGQYSGGVAVVAQSQLWGAEANVRRAWYAFLSDSTDLILGFRYIDLNERLAIDSPAFFSGGGSLDVRDSIRTRNTFYGGQVGFASRIGGTERGLGFEFTTKSGLGGVAQRAELVGSNTAVASGVADVESGGLYVRGLNAGTFTRDKFAYMQDLGIKLTYNFNPWVQVSFGYSFLYLSSVMRPGRAIDPVINDSNVRFVANPTPSNLPRPAFAWRAEELVVQGMTFGLRIQY